MNKDKAPASATIREHMLAAGQVPPSNVEVMTPAKKKEPPMAAVESPKTEDKKGLDRMQNIPETGDKNSETGDSSPTNHVEYMNMNAEQQPQQAPQQQPKQEVPQNLAFEAAVQNAVNTNLGSVTKITDVLSKRAEAGQPFVGMSTSEFAKRAAIVGGTVLITGILYKVTEHGLEALFRPAAV